MYSYGLVCYSQYIVLHTNIIVDHILTMTHLALDEYVPFISSEPWVSKVKAYMYMYMYDLQYGCHKSLQQPEW